MAELEARQLADLTFPEVTRALRALSSTYVERRTKLQEGSALAGAGKRAAFALYYGPLHYILVRHIVASLGPPWSTVASILDLGCGTGSSGAGWAAACARRPAMVGIDRNPWAADEARRTYRAFGLGAAVRVGDFTRELFDAPRGTRRQAGAAPAKGRAGVLLAFALNELSPDVDRDRLLDGLLTRADRGDHVLIVEPVARSVAPWWGAWQRAFEARGGRADEWRTRIRPPAIVEKLGRAAGLDVAELKARSLAL